MLGIGTIKLISFKIRYRSGSQTLCIRYGEWY